MARPYACFATAPVCLGPRVGASHGTLHSLADVRIRSGKSSNAVSSTLRSTHLHFFPPDRRARFFTSPHFCRVFPDGLTPVASADCKSVTSAAARRVAACALAAALVSATPMPSMGVSAADTTAVGHTIQTRRVFQDVEPVLQMAFLSDVPDKVAGLAPYDSSRAVSRIVSEALTYVQTHPTDLIRTLLQKDFLFAASLFPYLGFLWELRKATKEGVFPPLVFEGFCFLLVFVFATIPSGIYSRQHYGEELMNVDYLHGLAESLLSVTNLIIAIGFRRALLTLERQEQAREGEGSSGGDTTRDEY